LSTLNINPLDELFLPWVQSRNDRRFRTLLIVSVVIFSVFMSIVPFIEVPPPVKKDLKSVSPRLAALIMEKRKQPPPPPPKPIKKKVKKKPKVEKKPKKKKVTKKPKEKKKAVKKKADAMKKAASSGLMSMAAELNDLRDSFDVSELDDASLSKGNTKKQNFNAPVITSGAMQSSGGIKTSQLSSTTGGGKLKSRRTTKVSSNIDTGPSTRSVKRDSSGRAVRPQYEIEQVFQKNKSAIYSIYNRALRKDPTLQGKVVIELTIASNGKVIKARIVSSDLNNPKLERKLISRIKLFRFKAGKMGKVTVKYPIDFLPS